MKISIILITLIFSALSYALETTERETVYRCEQADGDQYLEIGVSLNDGPDYELLIVKYEDDDTTKTLVSSHLVAKITRDCIHPEACFSNEFDTVTFFVMKTDSGLEGVLYQLEDRPRKPPLRGLSCFKGGTISFDSK